MHACTGRYACTHMCAHTHTHSCPHRQAYLYTHMHIYECVYTHVHAQNPHKDSNSVLLRDSAVCPSLSKVGSRALSAGHCLNLLDLSRSWYHCNIQVPMRQGRRKNWAPNKCLTLKVPAVCPQLRAAYKGIRALDRGFLRSGVGGLEGTVKRSAGLLPVSPPPDTPSDSIRPLLHP